MNATIEDLHAQQEALLPQIKELELELVNAKEVTEQKVIYMDLMKKNGELFRLAMEIHHLKSKKQKKSFWKTFFQK